MIARANVLGHNILVLFATLCAEASFACTWATQNVIGDPNGLFIARAADRVESDREGGGVVGVPMQRHHKLEHRKRNVECVCECEFVGKQQRTIDQGLFLACTFQIVCAIQFACSIGGTR